MKIKRAEAKMLDTKKNDKEAKMSESNINHTDLSDRQNEPYMEDRIMGDKGYSSQERVMTKTDQKKTKQNFPEQKDALALQLRDREELFCQGKVQGKTDADSYLSAGYHAKNKASANTLAQRLLRKVYIQERLGVLRAETAERNKLAADDIFMQTGAILNADIGNYLTWGPMGLMLKPSSELTDEQRAAVESVTDTRNALGAGTVKFTLHNKLKAAELGARLLKMISDKPDPLGEVTLRIVYDKPKKANGD
jgi:phage terminase small subunit